MAISLPGSEVKASKAREGLNGKARENALIDSWAKAGKEAEPDTKYGRCIREIKENAAPFMERFTDGILSGNSEESDRGRGFPCFDAIVAVEGPISGILVDLPLQIKHKGFRREIGIFHSTNMDNLWAELAAGLFPWWCVVIHDEGFSLVNLRELIQRGMTRIRESHVVVSMAEAIDCGIARFYRGTFHPSRVVAKDFGCEDIRIR